MSSQQIDSTELVSQFGLEYQTVKFNPVQNYMYWSSFKWYIVIIALLYLSLS